MVLTGLDDAEATSVRLTRIVVRRMSTMLWSLFTVTFLIASSVRIILSEDDDTGDDYEGDEEMKDYNEVSDSTSNEEGGAEDEEDEEEEEYEDPGVGVAKTYGHEMEMHSYHPQPMYHQPQYHPHEPEHDHYHKPKKEEKKEEKKEKKHKKHKKHKIIHKKKKVYVPVFVPDKEKKKMKIISVDKGFFIQGGTQLFGKFKSLKHCMKACAVTPACLAGDYNPWLHKCYQHTNYTACNTLGAHPQYIHFSKIPCSVVDAPAGRVTLGASMANGIEQKGIDSLQQCIKKCAIAGGGVQPTATVPESFNRQACFAIDYDFSTHKCFFFGNNVLVSLSPLPIVIYLHCPAEANRLPSSLGSRPNPNVVHITFCPLPTGFSNTG